MAKIDYIGTTLKKYREHILDLTSFGIEKQIDLHKIDKSCNHLYKNKAHRKEMVF